MKDQPRDFPQPSFFERLITWTASAIVVFGFGALCAWCVYLLQGAGGF